MNVDFLNLHKICEILVYNMFIQKNVPLLVKIDPYLVDFKSNCNLDNMFLNDVEMQLCKIFSQIYILGVVLGS